MVHLEQCETPLLMCSSWMFLDSTHQFDEILGISSLTNSHQFLDVLGFYSPIWWNLRNIKSHQFSPILTRNIAINGEFPFKTQWQDLDRGELTGEATWEEPTEGLDLVFLPWRKIVEFLVFCWALSVFRFCSFWLFYVHWGVLSIWRYACHSFVVTNVWNLTSLLEMAIWGIYPWY